MRPDAARSGSMRLDAARSGSKRPDAARSGSKRLDAADGTDHLVSRRTPRCGWSIT